MQIRDNEINKIVDENSVKQLLLNYEIQDIIDNFEDYKTGFYDINYKLEFVKKIYLLDIKEIIYRLNTCWLADLEII